MRERATARIEAFPTVMTFPHADDVSVPGKEENLAGGALIRSTSQLGLWIFLATVTMLFAAFTSAYLVRKSGSDWQPVSLPAILWFNTALLLCSSVTMELGRARGKRLQTRGLRSWLLASTLLGLGFLLGQLLAWRQLAAQGVFLPSSPHSSFFYILTGLHGFHLLAGLLLLLYLLFRVRPGGNPGNRLAQRDLTNLCATYWHFLGGLWLYLFVMLSIG
ncbi:cytochrome c oxidase subunit 3 [Acidobacteria bacterium AH-259-O06]|nr:cytochrome c oxidase subunit 3 [Acidobacteria bacterium AH-259-O06]